jgi:hypothetical protein
MMSMVPILLMASAVGLAPHEQSAPCLTAERASHGVVFCLPKNVSFVLAGRTTGGRYSIYDYRYRFLPHPGGVMHGGQRLIVFQGKRYVGNYMLPPKVKIAVRGTWVVLKSDEGREAVQLDFSRSPPNRIFVDGEVNTFDR